MRAFLRRALCAILALCLTASLCFAAEGAENDLTGHWAERELLRAVEDGLLSGFEDGTMRPNAAITQAQMLSILCRMLRAEEDGEPGSLGLTGREWYAGAALGAAALGLISHAAGMSAAMTRGEALSLLCRALGLSQAEPERSVLADFQETDAPDEIAALVALGLVQGYEGRLNLSGPISRAEFVTVLYRAMGAAGPSAVAETGTVTGGDYPEGLWFGYDCDTVALSGVTAASALVCAGAIKSLRLSDNTRLARLTLACGGDLTPSIYGGSRVETLSLAQGTGKITVSGGVDRVEVTGHGREIIVSGALPELVIAGDGCTVRIRGGAAVQSLRVRGDGCTIYNDGGIRALAINGGDCTVEGYGYISETTLNTIRSAAPARPGKLTDNRDLGIRDVEIALTAPEALPLGEKLEAEAALTIPDTAVGKAVTVRWTLGAQLLSEETAVLGEAEQVFALSRTLEYSRDLPGRAALSFTLLYEGREESQTRSALSEEIDIENQPPAYYQAIDEARVLAAVDTGYEGDYTLAWAEQNDYTAADKALWVNAKGYASETEYLIWVSLKYQRCNIFQGQAGDWTLKRSSIVGSGAPGSGTPVGVWKTTYKQELGWTTATYTVKPVVRFKGGGYAFHSRLYLPNSDILSDGNIGFPVSHGCIRMYDEDVQWIFDHVPENTTVVVF